MGNNRYRERLFKIKASIAERCKDMQDDQCSSIFDEELVSIDPELKEKIESKESE